MTLRSSSADWQRSAERRAEGDPGRAVAVTPRDPQPRLVVYGARGSGAVSGAAFARYGGSTTCFGLELPDGHRVLIDCGSGLTRLQAELASPDDARPFEATVFLTHFHWDHLQGLPVFAPLYSPATRLHVVATPPAGMSILEAIDGAIRPPWFPVRFRDVPAQVTYQTLGEAAVSVGPLEVHPLRLSHPGGVTAFRLELGGRALVIATDVEAGDPEHDARVRAFARGADILIHDAQYAPGEYQAAKRGWGHSTWEHAARTAVEAGVGSLLLTSHDPARTDAQVDAFVAAAGAVFPSTTAAFEGQQVSFEVGASEAPSAGAEGGKGER